MSDNSKIEWTSSTWNPTTGCTKVSPGCANCYIAGTPPFRMAGRKFDSKGHIPLILHEDRLTAPLRWRKPRRIFVNSLSDLFHEDVPFEFIDRVFAVMALTPQHTYQVLTKRPARMRKYLATRPVDRDRWATVGLAMRSMSPRRHTAEGIAEYAAVADGRNWPLPNVWLGVTVENQHFADERIPILLDTPAAVRFLSCEPLLGPVDLHGFCGCDIQPGAHIDWVIVGGESGPNVRPTDIGHIRSIVRQCKVAGVPVFCKQLGANVRDGNDAGFEGDTPTAWPEGTKVRELRSPALNHQGATVGIGLKDRKGGDMAEWPEDLRVREFPGDRP